MKRCLSTLAVCLAFASVFAQHQSYLPTKTPKTSAFEHIEYKAEMQLSSSVNKTPLWLNANKYGLSSLEKTNGYVRGAIERKLSTDDEHVWGVGYGLDVVLPVNYTSKLIIQQAYAEGRWHKGVLTIGAKEQPMELKDNQLSSGSQTLGINARPIPQVRLALGEYWAIPYTKGWLKIKGHVAYGKMTDDSWQHSFTNQMSKYADDVLFHSKAGYLKIGNEESYRRWSLELGLEMAATFGGTAYIPVAGGMRKVENQKGISSFLKAFLPGGNDVTEAGTVYKNSEGNQVGSWLARINYDTDTWRMSVYVDKYFEDHSSMLLLDYDGYGEGAQWNVKEKRKYFRYDLKDWILGLSYRAKYHRWISGVTFEYIYSKYQSGPIYHDHTQGRKEHISGVDNFYNHHIYTGWQHWGQAIGNPLYTSPIYNKDGKIEFKNNRFEAIHFGIDGNPNDYFYYRILATYQTALGTYNDPFVKDKHNFSFLVESQYDFANAKNFLKGCSIKLGYGMDMGSLLEGINAGFQLTFIKKGLLK